MKDLISSVLTLIVCLVVCSFLSPTALAETIASGTSGDNLNWTLDKEGTLFISGYGDMISSDGWSEHIERTKTIVIEQGAAESAQEAAEQTKNDAEAAADSVSQNAAQIETNKQDIGDLKSQINTLQSNCAPVIINSASGNIASFSDGADGLPINALSVNIDPIQAGSGVPSPGNVRPISGRTSATVTWTGKNLCNTIDYSTTVNGVTATKNQDGTFSLSGTATDVTDIQIAFNLFFPAGEYVFNGGVDGLNGTGNTLYLTIRNRNGGSPRFIGNKTKTEFTHFSLEDGEYISYVFIRIANGTNTDGYSIAPMICFVNEDDPTYRPYAGNTYIFQLGNTVYGGDLDVTGGKMLVTMAMVDLGTLTWGYNTASAFFYATKAGLKTYANNDTPNWLCSSFSTGAALFPAGMASASDMSIRPRANADQIQVKDTEYTDAAAFKTAMSGVQLCYELATPLEITLTPTQINTLLGANNTWSDAGTVDVEYRADTKLYIDNIHKPTEDDMTANAQILSGRYFLIGGALYRSTATIPAGDTIRPGTNCVQTNLAEALNALNT